MRLQPSASRTELLLACPRPFGLDAEVEADAPGEPARYGSAFHQVIAACLRAKKPLEQTAAYARAVDKAAKNAPPGQVSKAIQEVVQKYSRQV